MKKETQKNHQAVIFVGIQASGKSTFFKNEFADTHVRINLDMLKNRRRESILLEACLSAKQSFVVDNTNLRVEDRERYLKQVTSKEFERVCYYFEPFVHIAMRRNSARDTGKVPDVAIRNAVNSLQVPTYAEGFDKIYRVNSMTNSFKEVNNDGLYAGTAVRTAHSAG